MTRPTNPCNQLRSKVRNLPRLMHTRFERHPRLGELLKRVEGV